MSLCCLDFTLMQTLQSRMGLCGGLLVSMGSLAQIENTYRGKLFESSMRPVDICGSVWGTSTKSSLVVRRKGGHLDPRFAWTVLEKLWTSAAYRISGLRVTCSHGEIIAFQVISTFVNDLIGRWQMGFGGTDSQHLRLLMEIRDTLTIDL